MASESYSAKTRRADRNRRYQERVKAGLTPASRTAPKTTREPLKITDSMLTWSMGSKDRADPNDLFRPAAPAYPPGVVSGTKSAPSIAMDDAFSGVTSWAASAYPAGLISDGQVFPGFPYLAQLALRPEYRKISETIATEMTRRWIKVQSIGEDEGGEDKSEKIKLLNDALERLHVRDVYRKAIEVDGYFGGSHILPDFGTDSDEELKTPIGNGRDAASKTKIKKGSLRGFKVIEPMWVYPTGYDATNPLSPEWYKPQAWQVFGRPVHRSRLLTMVGREVPDVLKPAYQFRGLSLSQMVKPYVDNWLRTRQSVSDLIHAFTVFVLETDLQTQSQGIGDGLMKRVQLFNNLRDNRGMMVLNKDTEAFSNVSAQLGTLDHLQAQSQEQMASVASIPLVKLLGITPSGLNASSDGEVRVFYDWVHAKQESQCSPSLDTIFAWVQLSIFGEVDPDLTYKWEPLWTLNEKELAEVQQIKASTAQIHIDAGVISPHEERQRIADDPDGPYSSLDEDLPEGLEPADPGDPTTEEDASEDDGSHPRPFEHAQDAEFNEEDHPRGEGGKFTGSVHVVSSHDEDENKTKVHGVYASEPQARQALQKHTQKLYAEMREDMTGNKPAKRIAHATAVGRLKEHGYDNHMAKVTPFRVGGSSAPESVHLVNGFEPDPDSSVGEHQRVIHGAFSDPKDAMGLARHHSENMWAAHGETRNGEITDRERKQVSRAYNEDAADEHVVDNDLDFEDDDPVNEAVEKWNSGRPVEDHMEYNQFVRSAPFSLKSKLNMHKDFGKGEHAGETEEQYFARSKAQEVREETLRQELHADHEVVRDRTAAHQRLDAVQERLFPSDEVKPYPGLNQANRHFEDGFDTHGVVKVKKHSVIGGTRQPAQSPVS